MPIFVRAIFANPVSRISMIILILISTILAVMFMRPRRFSGPDSVDELLFAYLILFELFSIALVLLVGIWTRDFYIRAREHIEEYKRIDRRFAREMSAPCQRTGLRLAAKDMSYKMDM